MDVIDRLQPEISHKSYHEDESAKVSAKKGDLESPVAAYSSKLETAVSKMSALDDDVAELQADLDDLPQQLKMDSMRVDMRKIFAGAVMGTTGDKSFPLEICSRRYRLSGRGTLRTTRSPWTIWIAVRMPSFS